MGVYIKQGVLGDVQRPIRRAIGVLASMHAEHGEDLMITSLREGNHSPGSLHYDGLAKDSKRGSLTAQEIRAKLGPGYDVVCYNINPYVVTEQGKYVHVEWDPE